MNSATRAKMKYNRETYKRYEFNVRANSTLNGIIERYKKNPENNFSELIKTCLCQHFGLSRWEADLIFTPYFYGRNGEHLVNNAIDKYFPDNDA